MATTNITTPQTAHGGMEAAIAELDATINYLSRQPETDTAVTSAMISATTARAVLRDLMDSLQVGYVACLHPELDAKQGSECNDIEKLRAAVTDMDCLSQGGFSEIAAIAKLALASLEHPDGYLHSENIAHALRAIWVKADEVENCINYNAEEVGCNYRDPSTARRYAARAAAREMGAA